MNKVREYEHYSIQCAELAAHAPDAAVRSQYLKLAEMWRNLAEERRAFLQSKSLD